MRKPGFIAIPSSRSVPWFLAKTVFGKKLKLRWNVVETPTMVSRAIGLQDGQLEFFDDLQKAKNALDRIDLVFSSGALPYLPRPYEVLDRLTECGASNIFITRVGFSPLPRELVIVQRSKLSDNGPGPLPEGMRDGRVQYPATFVLKERVEEIRHAWIFRVEKGRQITL